MREEGDVCYDFFVTAQVRSGSAEGEKRGVAFVPEGRRFLPGAGVTPLWWS